MMQTRQLNANRTAITKIGRKVYARTYPTVLVQEDGSTYNIKYKEPRKIIKVSLLSGIRDLFGSLIELLSCSST